jgi:2-keto-4-pentenoate hydratase/2-oxohepta-3-ene-1,7-dioic acid hydratase in catechol pathway
MKIARFSAAGADPRYGILDGDEYVVLAGDPMFSGYETTGERVPAAQAKLLAPVIPRSKVVCVGLNFRDHQADMEIAGPSSPLLFLKPNTAVVGPGDPIQLPPNVGKVVHEGELAVVIGSVAKRVRAADAESVIFGYTIANDVSARDQMKLDGQWARAKGYDSFCPLGPVIETEIDPSALEIQTFVDGEPRRHGNTRDMIHSVAEVIEYASDVFTLLPGDLILMGTPAGKGQFIDGQTVDITIEGIGTLSNPAVDRR